MMKSHDIPLEAVLKWIKKERDSYKAKLDRLVPYTKSLEQRNRELEIENTRLRKENSGLASDITKSTIYKGLMERYVKVKRDKETLLEKLARHEKRYHGMTPRKMSSSSIWAESSRMRYTPRSSSQSQTSWN